VEILVKVLALCIAGMLFTVSACASPEANEPKESAKAAPAHAGPASMKRENLQEVSATVITADPYTRMIGLLAEDGKRSAIKAGPEVRNFEQIKEGDKVVVSYYQGLAAQVLPPDTPVSNQVDQLDLATRAEQGAAPGAGVGTAIRASVVIEGVDTKGNTVTFRRPDGMSRTLPVQSEEGRAFLRKIKAGDKVDVVYAEALAVEVRAK
jgi:hypothetical protein